MRDAVIATMDTGNRTWDHEVIPADRLERALQDTSRWLEPLADHHALHGPDPDTLPDRDFLVGSWQCRSCPFLGHLPAGRRGMGAKTRAGTGGPRGERRGGPGGVKTYTEARQSTKAPEKAKRAALATLKAWIRRKG